MRRFLPLSLVILASCTGPVVETTPAVVVVEHRAGTGVPIVSEAPVNATVVIRAEYPLATHRLGDAIYVSYFAAVRPEPQLRVVRVEDDGKLTDVAAGVPSSSWVRNRSGHETVSGDVSAMLGEPGKPWMAFRRYSLFGEARMYRADGESWREGAIGPGIGDIWTNRSRGHLFKIVNRVSGDGRYYRFVRGTIEPIDPASPFELADGSIVDVGALVPEIADVTHADGRSTNDFWALGGGILVRVRGATHEQVPLPDPRCTNLLVESDGFVWLSGGPVAYRRSDAAPEWSAHRIVAGYGFARVIAARAAHVFALDEQLPAAPVLRRVEL